MLEVDTINSFRKYVCKFFDLENIHSFLMARTCIDVDYMTTKKTNSKI